LSFVAAKAIALEILSRLEKLQVSVASDVPAESPDSRIETIEADNTSGWISLRTEVCRFEAAMIIRALAYTDGHQARAARLLGLDSSTLNRKIKYYKIPLPKKLSGGLGTAVPVAANHGRGTELFTEANDQADGRTPGGCFKAAK
jgi:hypothetical protein